jgi:hypothetical protein
MKQGIKEKDIRDFVSTCNKMNAIIERIREYKFEAWIYLADGSMNLMSEFNGDGGREDPEKSVASVFMNYTDGGGW